MCNGIKDWWEDKDWNQRGKDVSAGNKSQGFTHVLESTFESMEGVAEYIAHPAHVDTQMCSCLMWKVPVI
ncbi:stress-response a/b barrel domain-containing protein hs1 [Quercus suber]|uniref:Stress-response a/b barrel domain-containing protein hs1 n=1 Tax=Quercus suber TaxID=58331 RepID=A0AAW0LRT1_QUESU